MEIKSIQESTVFDFIKVIKEIDQETSFLLLLPEERKLGEGSSKIILEKFGDGKGIGFLAYNDNKICGYIMSVRRFNYKSKHVIGFVIAVTKAVYGQGHAEELLKKFEKKCIMESIEVIRISVIENNYRAIQFYLKNNYKIEGVLNNNIQQQNGIFSEYSMFKMLRN